MTTTTDRARARFLLEVALDHENLKQRIAQKLKTHRESLRPPQGEPQLDYRDRFKINGRSVSYRQYQRWEAGESMPEWKWMVVIAEVLGTTQQALLCDDDEEEGFGGGSSAPPPGARPGPPAVDEDALTARVEARLRRIEEALGIPPEESISHPSGTAAHDG